MNPLPGAAEWIAALKNGGWRQAIASSAPRLNVQAILEALNLQKYFDAFTSAEDVTRGKPDPQVFLTAASRIGVPPAHCIVVEDVPAGVEAARKGGMRSIGVNRTITLDADVYVRSLDELEPGAFDRLLNSSV